MLNDVWSGLLSLLSQFVIPDWGALIALLPVFIAILVVLILAIVFRRLNAAPAARRGKFRIEPRTPPGIHMPGPSWAPVFAAFGAFALFLGIVFEGPLLIAGVTVLILTLLVWGAESIRIYDHELGATAAQLPAVVHAGPPPGVHMPGPSFRPLLAAIGAAMLLAGLVFEGWVLAAGVIVLILTLVGWGIDAVAEYRKTEEADDTGHLENLPDPRTPTRLLWVIGAVMIAAIVIQAGWIPPRASEGAEGEGPVPSAAPGGENGGNGSGGGGATPAPELEIPDADVTITAQGVAFTESGFTAPADTPFTIAFVNLDANVPHNVDIQGGIDYVGEIINGPAVIVYEVPAIPAGSYPFICTVHPNMTGTATIQ
jgi:plastocyanin